MANPLQSQEGGDKKLHYLGRGVDCRKGHKEWLRDLERYSGDPIRNIQKDGKNIREDPVCFSEKINDRTERETDIGAGNKIRIQHGFVPLDLSTDFEVKLDTKWTTTDRRHRIICGNATLIDAVKYDPKAKQVKSGHHMTWYSKLEQDLCAHILQTSESDANFKELFPTDNPVPAEYDCAITVFDDLIKRVKENKEMKEKFWRFVTDACISFLKERPYTHYVYNITLGAERLEIDASNTSALSLSAGVKADVPAVGEIGGTANYVKKGEQHTLNVQERGRIESDGTLSTEEVVDIAVKSIVVLIYNKPLKAVMHAILESYNILGKDSEPGLYRIFCRERVHSSAKEQEIYWHVINNEEIYGTTKPDEASLFSIEIVEDDPSLLFHIIYKTSSNTVLMVKVEQQHLPLQLVQSSSTWEASDLIYTLQDAKDETKQAPASAYAWKGSSFFVKQPSRWWRFSKARYIKMEECSKESMPMYQTSTCSTIDTKKCDMMLFYIQKVAEIPEDHGCVLQPLTSGPLPESTAESGHAHLWRIQQDREVTMKMFYDLVGTDEIIL